MNIFWGYEDFVDIFMGSSQNWASLRVISQGLFLVNYIAVIALLGYIPNAKKYLFFPNFWRKIPNFGCLDLPKQNPNTGTKPKYRNETLK